MPKPRPISARELENRVADITVTNIRRADHGELEAEVTVRGDTVAVTRQSGSWGFPNPEGRGWTGILTPYAIELQRHARAFEKREKS